MGDMGMGHNKLPASEMDAVIDLLFIVSDALLLCEKLSNVDSVLQTELARHLTRSYEIANEMLLHSDFPKNDISHASRKKAVKLRSS